MAFSYPHTPILSKIKIGDVTYYLKDADARAILDSAVSVIDNSSNLATASAVKAYVDSAISSVPDFDAVVSTTAANTPYGVQWEDDGGNLITGTLQASADTFHKIYLVKQLGATGTYVEWMTIRTLTGDANNLVGQAEVGTAEATGENYTYSWEQIGSTAINLSGYVQEVKYENKTLSQEYNSVWYSVHTFGDLADKNNASTTLTDYATSVNGVSYTPAGDVTVTSVSVTPATSSVAVVTNSGTAYTLSGGELSKSADTTSTFATAGVTATVGTGADSETLIISTATTASAITSAGSISYTAPTLSGSLPTFSTATVVTGITGATASATFSGSASTITPTLSTSNKTITVS